MEIGRGCCQHIPEIKMIIEQKTKFAKFKCQISAKHKMVLMLIEVLEVSELVDWFNICQDCPTKIITLEAIGSPQNSKFNVFCTILKLRCFLLTALHIILEDLSKSCFKN